MTLRTVCATISERLAKLREASVTSAVRVVFKLGMKIARVIALFILLMPLVSASEAVADESGPRMLTPRTIILEKTRTIEIKSRLVHWLDDDLSAFLESGLPIRLEFRAGVFERRGYWFDEKIASASIDKEITYDPVTKSYTIVSWLDGKKCTKSFVERKDAMNQLLAFPASIPLPLWMEKHPTRLYYSGVFCNVKANEMVFPLPYLLWFRRKGYTTDWAFSENISTKMLQSDGHLKKGKPTPKDTPNQLRRWR